jgi:hypothetical protein
MVLKWWWGTPPPTLHLIYEGRVVAELKRERIEDQELYHFRYLPAFKEASLGSLPGLSLDVVDHWSEELWSFFVERIPDIDRPEIQALLKERKINRYDQLQLLKELGSRAVTDPFEIRVAEAS